MQQHCRCLQQLAARCKTPFCWPQVLRFVLDAVRAEGFNNKRTLFLFGSYTIGKEKIFLEVARALKHKVWPHQASTTLPAAAAVHVCVSLLSWMSHLSPANRMSLGLHTSRTGSNWWCSHAPAMLLCMAASGLLLDDAQMALCICQPGQLGGQMMGALETMAAVDAINGCTALQAAAISLALCHNIKLGEGSTIAFFFHPGDMAAGHAPACRPEGTVSLASKDVLQCCRLPPWLTQARLTTYKEKTCSPCRSMSAWPRRRCCSALTWTPARCPC